MPSAALVSFCLSLHKANAFGGSSPAKLRSLFPSALVASATKKEPRRSLTESPPRLLESGVATTAALLSACSDGIVVTFTLSGDEALFFSISRKRHAGNACPLSPPLDPKRGFEALSIVERVAGTVLFKRTPASADVDVTDDGVGGCWAFFNATVVDATLPADTFRRSMLRNFQGGIFALAPSTAEDEGE